MAENLWGELPSFGLTRTPYNLLLEQATLLKDMSKDWLIGKVERNTRNTYTPDKEPEKDKSIFNLELFIVAPSLNNYTYSVLHAHHGLDTYPIYISSCDGQHCESKNEDEFLGALKHILSSDKVKKVIAALLTQIISDKTPAPKRQSVADFGAL